MGGHGLHDGLRTVEGHELANELIVGCGIVLCMSGDNQAHKGNGQGQTGTQTTSPVRVTMIRQRYA
jgi:hypothetical protein